MFTAAKARSEALVQQRIVLQKTIVLSYSCIDEVSTDSRKTNRYTPSF